jgi:hypothetical protein
MKPGSFPEILRKLIGLGVQRAEVGKRMHPLGNSPRRCSKRVILMRFRRRPVRHGDSPWRSCISKLARAVLAEMEAGDEFSGVPA